MKKTKMKNVEMKKAINKLKKITRILIELINDLEAENAFKDRKG